MIEALAGVEYDPTIADAAGTIAATAAIGIYRHVRQIHGQIERNSRVLHGVEDSDAYDGLTTQVQDHEQALREEDLL